MFVCVLSYVDPLLCILYRFWECVFIIYTCSTMCALFTISSWSYFIVCQHVLLEIAYEYVFVPSHVAVFFQLCAPIKSDFLLFIQSDSPVGLCCDEPPSNEPPWDCKQYSNNISSFLEQCLLVVGISHQKWIPKQKRRGNNWQLYWTCELLASQNEPLLQNTHRVSLQMQFSHQAREEDYQ